MTTPAGSMPRGEAATLLGVPQNASPAEVQRGYLRAARRTHPDLLPDSDEAGRLAAGAAFDRLTRARAVLLEPAPERPAPRASGPDGADVPTYERFPRNGHGGSLVLLVMLGFLLVAIVTLQRALGFGAP